MIKFYDNHIKYDPKIIETLEEEFANYTGFEYAVAVDSCTNALKLCLEYEKPIMVGVPTMTFVSVANEVIHSGAKLRLLDSCRSGYAYKLEGTNIIDSAHEVEKRVLHSEDDKYCYSFYPTKLCPSYQGGMICTDNLHFAEWARTARQMGRTDYGAYYDVEIVGWKCNMTPIQAKMALESLHNLDKVKRKAQRQCKFYLEELEVWTYRYTDHLYILEIDNRDDFIKYAKNNGVECSIHFLPIHQKKAYRNISYKANNFLCTNKLSKRIVSLPLHPLLTKKDQRKVIEVVKAWKGKL